MNMRCLLLPIALALVVSSCSRDPEELLAAEESTVRESAVTITAAEAKQTAVPIQLEAVGDVNTIEAPTIGAEVSGRITDVLVDVGDMVAKGDLLGRIDRSGIELQLDAARAEQGRVDALAANQEIEVKRLRDLKQKSFISTSAIDAAEAQLRAVREQQKVARAQVALAQDRLNKAAIQAPAAGKIDARFISVGDYVRDGAPLFSIADTSALRLVMVFPEQAMGRLRKGTPLEVITAVNPGVKFTAAITEIRPQVEAANKGVVAYADLQDPDVTEAGASATVWATLEVHDHSIVVPQLSLVQRPAGEVVYVIRPDSRAEERKVVSGARLDGGVEIVSGLSPGERVAVDGAGFLSNGVKVEVRS